MTNQCNVTVLADQCQILHKTAPSYTNMIS